MLVMSFFSWWYGRGWKTVIDSLKPRLQGMADAFSVRQLVRTWFAPWRRIMSEPGRSLDDKMRAAVDNAFSRVVGFVVRSCVLIAACITLTVVAVLILLEIIVWPLLPLAIPGFLITGLVL
jgi:hypothetical protein